MDAGALYRRGSDLEQLDFLAGFLAKEIEAAEERLATFKMMQAHFANHKHALTSQAVLFNWPDFLVFVQNRDQTLFKILGNSQVSTFTPTKLEIRATGIDAGFLKDRRAKIAELLELFAGVAYVVEIVI